MPIPSDEELQRLVQEYEAGRAARAAAPSPPIPAAAPPQGRRQQIKKQEVTRDLQEAEIAAEDAEDDLYSQLLAEVRRENSLLTPAAAREEAKRRLEQMRPGPYYVGGFKPVEFKSAAGVLPVARPQEFPVAPDKPVTFAEALAPQTRAGARAVDKVKREQTASIFDDRAFNDGIKALPDADKREQLDAYEAYKAAFKKIRDLNPLETSGVTDEDIKRDLDRQLKALGSGDIQTFVDDPANRMGYSGDPLARALQKQVTTGAPVPVLEPGQTEFVSTLDRLQRSRATAAAAAEAEGRLRKQGVSVTKKVRKPTGERGPGGRPIFEEVEVPTGQFRPATPEDIKRARENVAAFTDKEMPKPLYAETGKLDQFIKANEKASKGGLIFQKELPTGATVESPVSWFVRSALAVPNALVGAASELPFFTPEVIKKREREGRPALYKDAPAFIYNVAGNRGLMGEIGDLYEYAPESWTIGGKPLKEYTTYAKAAGFAGDLIGFDLGLIGGVVTGAKAAVTTARAARAAEGAVAAAKATLPAGVKAASKEFLETIGLRGTASKFPVGDVRLQFGVSFGDSMRAADEYRAALAAGDTVPDALRRAETVAPKSKFVADATKKPPTTLDQIDDIFKDAKAEWDEVKTVGDEVRRLRAGGKTPSLAVRPYITAAVRNTPELTSLLKSKTGTFERVKVGELFDEVSTLSPDRQDSFYNTIIDAVTAEKGVQGIDRAIGSVDPGRFTIRLTPNTFTTSDNADAILKTVKETPEYKLVKGITSDGVNAKGTYDVVGPDKDDLLVFIERDGASGAIPRSQLQRIVRDVNNGSISGDDLRLFMNGVADTVANEGRTGRGAARAFRERALAAEQPVDLPRLSPVKAASPPSLRTEGETAGIFNRAWTRFADGLGNFAKGPSDMSRYLSRQQIRILEEGKRKIGGLGELMKAKQAELLRGNPPITDTLDQAIALVGDLKNPETWRRIARSSVFGRSDTSLFDLIRGNIAYKEPFQFLNAAGRRQLDEVIGRYTNLGLPPDQYVLTQFIDEIRAIAGDDTLVLPSFLKGAGVVFDLKPKPVEVLAGAWARKEAEAIMSDTIARVIDFEPDTIGGVTEILRLVLGDLKTADGRLLADIPVNTLVGDAMAKGGVISTTPTKLAGIKSFNDEVSKIPDAYFDGRGVKPAFVKRYLQSLVSDGGIAALMTDDVNSTLGLLTAKYGSNADIIAAEGQRLLSGKGTIGETGGPLGTLLGKAIRDDFGKTIDFKAFTTELGILAELEAKGDIARSDALRVSRALTSAQDTFNSVFYNLILSYNLRYHGTNFVTGPFIGYTTTGRIPNPIQFGKAAVVIGRGEQAAARSAVVTTDRTTGVPITLGELYDRAKSGGVFKSQIGAQLDPRFLDDAKRLGFATMGGKGKAANAILNGLRYPAEAANASDFVWRMSYVLNALDEGKGLDEAMDVGRRSLYDYGSATPFERKYIAKNILFYNFFRNSLLETGRQALTSPARLARQFRLTKDYSDLTVGEEKWNEMRFYTPYEAGVARLVLDFAPAAGREGNITLFPNMPWYDAVYITSGLLTMPLNLIAGTADPVTGKRDYGSGYIFQKLSPSTQALLGVVTGADMLADIRMKKGELPVQHAAVFDELGALPLITKKFNLKKIPAEGGQTGWNGYVYTMEPADFESYQRFVKGAKVIGAQRPFDDYSKWFATWDLDSDIDRVTGPAEAATMGGIGEAAGFTLDTRAGVPAEAEIKAAQTRARQAEQDVKEVTPTPEEVRAGRKR